MREMRGIEGGNRNVFDLRPNRSNQARRDTKPGMFSHAWAWGNSAARREIVLNLALFAFMSEWRLASRNVCAPACQRGFTLMELIVILVIVGILAVTAIPRFFDSKIFESRGFHDETQSLLRYAQKAAVAQRRTVNVNVTATGVILNIVNLPPPATACPCTLLALPATPRGGTGLSAAPTSNFNFLASGGTDQVLNVALTVTGSTGITVDAVTGYVY